MLEARILTAEGMDADAELSASEVAVVRALTTGLFRSTTVPNTLRQSELGTRVETEGNWAHVEEEHFRWIGNRHDLSLENTYGFWFGAGN